MPKLLFILVMGCIAAAPPEVTPAFLMGKFDYREHPGFRLVEPAYSNKPIYLQKPVADAYEAMYEAAQKEGISLTLISGTRSFEEQKVIWERKWTSRTFNTDKEKALDILLFSSMPSTSRHHWGTDIDVVSLENDFFEAGAGKRAYDWLVQRAPEFGFCQPYTDQSDGRKGYQMEKWHWSYMPISSDYVKQYNRQVTYDDITGFLGAETAREVHAIEHYVNGITCK